MTPVPVRGQIYRVDLGDGPKPWLIVSNNSRNRKTADVLATRVTTTPRNLPTWVELSHEDPIVGLVNTENIEIIGREDLGQYLGSLCASTVMRINEALRIAFGIL